MSYVSVLEVSFELTQGRTNVSAILSADILVNVCDKLDSTAENAVMLKHEANQAILALSNTCRSWRYHITGCKSLFRNIAFDASFEESIVTAGIFLKALEGTVIPITVHANLGRSPSRDPMIVKLFGQLRSHIPHIVHFEYDGDMARYRPYLDCPAPNLLFFSDNFDTYPGSGPPLFRGQMPGLRVMTTLSPAPQVLWITSTLSDLTILNLGFLGLDLYIPLGSFLDLLRRSPRLERLSVQCFVPAIDPSEDLEDVFLPCLDTLSLQHNEFHTIIKRLRIPNIRKLFFSGESHPASGEGLNPTFKATHLFAGLPLLPIFERPIESLRLETTGNGRTSGDFCLRLTAGGGFILRVSLSWILDAIPLFGGYVKRSVLGLIEIVTFAAQAQVGLFHAYLVPSDIPVYQPLLLVTDIDQLTVQGGFAVDVLKKLTLGAGSQHLLPRLRLLNIVDQLPFSGEEGRRVLLSCLRSRADGDVHFSVRLVDTEVHRADFSEPGYIAKREFREHRCCL